MIKIVLGIVIGLSIGAGCRFLEIPLPAPPKLIGALLVVAMTFGYLGADRFLSVDQSRGAAGRQTRSPQSGTHLSTPPHERRSERP